MVFWEGSNRRNFFIFKITGRSGVWWYDVKATYFSICEHKLVFLFSFDRKKSDGDRLSSRSRNLENKTKYVVTSLYCCLQHYFLLRISRYLLYQCTCRVKTISDHGFYQNRIQY